MSATPNPAVVRERWDGFNLDATLSPERLHLAYLIVEGLSGPQIAATLGISEDLVKYLVGKVLRATGAASRHLLVVWMYEAGHITPPTPLPQRTAAEMRLAAVREQLLTVRDDLDTLARTLAVPEPGQHPGHGNAANTAPSTEGSAE